MDRKIIYPGQIPLETDLLGTNQNTMVALSKLASALFGTSTTAIGLAVGPSSPAALTVVVSPGEVYSLQPLEGTAYSSIPADTTHSIVKQGILLDAATLACPAPTTAGFSINYLIEAAYQEVDDTSTVLPFYNASNPSQAYSGPNNSGASSATRRAGTVVLQAKAGIAATTGTQTTPAADAGYVALAVVTVANGQSTIVAGNIVASGLPVNTPISSGRLLNIQTFPSSGTYTPTSGARRIRIRAIGGGGGGGGVSATSAGQVNISGGGASGAYIEIWTNVPTSPQSFIIGSGGAAGAATGGSGGAGGATSMGAIFTAPGGPGGQLGSPAAPPLLIPGAAATSGIVTSGLVVASIPGVGGNPAIALSTTILNVGGGGSNVFGFGQQRGSLGAGVPGPAPGSGGTGAAIGPSTAGALGGTGAAGVMVIEEYA